MSSPLFKVNIPSLTWVIKPRTLPKEGPASVSKTVAPTKSAMMQSRLSTKS